MWLSNSARMLRLPVVAALSILTAACSDGCGNTVVAERINPSNTTKAVMFRRDCGATTGFSTQVSLIEQGSVLSGSGNVFRADDDHGAASVGAWGGPWAEIAWNGPDRLVIRYAARSRMFEQKKERSGVRVEYDVVEK